MRKPLLVVRVNTVGSKGSLYEILERSDFSEWNKDAGGHFTYLH